MGSVGPDSENHRLARAKLRHATFIDARTGATSRRSINLLDPDEQFGPPPSNGNTTNGGALAAVQEVLGSSSRSGTKCHTIWGRTKGYTAKARAFVVSDMGKSMFKCAVAYLLGSMWTFLPILNNLLGPMDSKHTVATMTVYFHPARSIGSMLEALVMATGAFCYTASVGLASMGVSILFTDKLHQVILGHIIVLIVFVGGGLSMIGLTKLKTNNPLVSIACSLMNLSLISVLTKEGAVQAGDLSFGKIGQYLKMIAAGVSATMIVSFCVLPVSAQSKFKKNMVSATDGLSDMLGLITNSFMSGDEAELEDHEYSAVSDKYTKVSNSVNQTLREVKFELYVVGREIEYRISKRLVQCMQKIGQSVGGLRSAAAMQFVVIKQPAPFSTVQSSAFTSRMTSPIATPGVERQPTDTTDFGSILGRIMESNNETISEGDTGTGTTRRRVTKYKAPRQIFELFIEHLGPSMKSLAFTMKEILDDLPFDPELNYAVAINPRFRVSLERALELYKEARKVALERVYNKRDLNHNRPASVEADWEEAAACCGHFSFCLLEVAEQLKEYLVTLDELEAEIAERPSGRTWNFLRFWRSPSEGHSTRKETDLTKAHQEAEANIKISTPKPAESAYDRQAQFIGERGELKQRVYRRIYDAFSFFRREDTKFTIKVAIGAILYAVPSYVEYTRPIYTHWRGEWGLLSYMLVCSVTVGASNSTGWERSWGTCFGALLAMICWEVSGEDPIVLAIFGFIMAYWTAYVILAMNKGPLGRFIMLAYNLSALYAYGLVVADFDSDRDEQDDDHSPVIWEIALHRCVAVISGCIWGLIITRTVWPISAREKLKNGLSLLWLRMGLIWKRDPLSTLIEGEDSNPFAYMDLREEVSLQRFLASLKTLVGTSMHEVELRRPFPADAYRRILTSTSRMLEAFHTMNIVMLKEDRATPGEEALLEATENERAQLCARISHQFGVLASSLKLEYSIATEALPSTEHTRDRLLSRVFAYRKHDADDRITTDEDYGLIYTYALVTGLVGTEIKNCLKEVEALFGILDEESLRLQ